MQSCVRGRSGARPSNGWWPPARTTASSSPGERIARVDLAFPEHKVAVEYDGDWRDGESWALNRDRDRLNRVHAQDWTVIFVTAPLLRDERRMIRTVRAALPT
jgi:very-short-patch-repair endonuclease